jgi:hypothetical protein
MADLKTVQASMNGDKVPAKKEDFFGISDGLQPTAVAKQEYVIFRLVKKKKGRTHVDGVCDNVMNPVKKRRERIYLLQGADSIWQSDLVELLKDKEYVRSNRRSLLFENGVCRIPVWDERALEYARANLKNVGSLRSGNGKFDYYEYDANAEQAERHKKQVLKIDMVIKAKEMPVEKMKKLASFLGISFIDELGMPKGDEGVRTELMIKADNNPELFSKYIDSQEVDIQYMVKKAIIDAKIDLTGQSGNALWANGKGFICKIPAGRKSYEYLTELAMTNSDEGRNFKEQLQTFG